MLGDYAALHYIFLKKAGEGMMSESGNNHEGLSKVKDVNSKHAVIALIPDQEHTILQWDKGFEAMTGYSEADIEHGGRIFVPFVHEEDRECFMNLLHGQMNQDGLPDIEFRLRKKNGTCVWILMTGCRKHWAQEKDLGSQVSNGRDETAIIASLTDVDELRRRQDGLKESNRDLLAYISNIPGGFFRFDAGNPRHIEYVSDGMLKIIECSREEWNTLGREDPSGFFYKEDMGFIADKLVECQYSAETIEFDCRIETFRKKLKWILTSLKPVVDEGGNRWVYAVVTDISVLKKTQFELKQGRDRLNIMLNLYQDQIFEYDVLNDSAVFFKNEKLGRLKDNTLINCKADIAETSNIFDEDREAFLSFLDSKEAAALEYRFIDPIGNAVWCSIQCDTIKDENGTVIRLIGCIRDIDRQKREREQLLYKTRLDSLTQLYNKHYTQELVEQCMAEQNGRGTHGMLLVDIDNFKLINNNLGHLFGDTVLTNIAERLNALIAADDIIGRVGGDEFLIFMKNISNKDQLLKKTAEISDCIHETYAGESMKDKISCSIGIAVYPQDGTSYGTLFKNTDRALFQVKECGKNGYRFYDSQSMKACTRSETALEEYYNNYELDYNTDKGFREFNMDIVSFAFDIMAKTKDVTSAINLLLGKVGRQFRSDCIIIFEKVPDQKILTNTYQWAKEGFSYLKNEKHLIDYREHDAFIKVYDSNGIFSIPDMEPYRGSPVLNIPVFRRADFKAMIQCAIIEDEEFKGCVVVGDCHGPRDWTNSEVNSLVTITKVISSYLLKMRISAKMQTRLEHIKNFDSLTGLSTLHKFKKDAKAVIAENPDAKYAVVYSDIRNFKYMNDTFGYEEGDRILRDFAGLITESLSHSKCVCRVSSDNFLTMVRYETEEELAESTLLLNVRFNKIQKAHNINSNLVVISGIAIVDPTEDIMTAIDNANLARKSGKNASKTICNFYDARMKDKIIYEGEIANTMESALQQGEFQLYLQPKFRLSDDRMVGAEALVRWVRKDGRIIPPDEFVPIFEKNGFIVNMDFYIYEKVCQFLRRCLDGGQSVVPVSVNVSRVHLNDDKFVNNFIKLTQAYKLPPELLELELTESIFLDNTAVALDTMRKFRSLGFSVSIDDFGAGYSSLNLLKDMETDVLKLDKEFFRQGEMQKEEKIIVSSIISMAKQLNMKVLSEGVETKNQMEFLKDISCDMAQGYLYARPMPVQEFLHSMDK